MPHVQIAKNTLYQLLGKISTAAIGLVLTLLIAHVYGADGYGTYTKVVFLVSLCFLIVDFGINALYLQEDKLNLSDFINFRLYLALMLFLILNVSLWVIPLFSIAFPAVVKIGVLFYSLSIFTQALILSSSALFQKKLEYKKLVIAQALGSFLSLLFAIFFISFSASIYYILLSLLIGNIFSALLAISFSKVRIHFALPKMDYIILFKQSAPLGIVLFCNLIYFRADIFILSFFTSSTAVGIYGYAYRYFDFLIALPLFLSNSIYPSLIPRKNIRNGSQITFVYSFVYILLGAFLALISFLAAPLIGIVKPEFTLSILPFRILIISLPIFFITSFLQWQLIAKRKIKFLLFIYLFSAVVNIVLNYIFIPQGGYIAASWITDISEVVVFILLLLTVGVLKIWERP